VSTTPPFEDPDANLQLYDFLKRQNQKASRFMIGANIIRDNPQWRSARRRLPLYNHRAGYRQSDIGQESSNQNMVRLDPLLFRFALSLMNTRSGYVLYLSCTQ